MKKSWKVSVSIFFTLLNTQFSFSCIEGKDGLFPKNSYYFPKNFSPSGIQEDDFMKVIEKVSVIYKPIVKKMGGELVVNPLWDDGEINASAQRFGKEWVVNMYGGLARHPLTTPDAFTLVLCHEIGHHIGGAPRYEENTSWASTEGQSDYFGTLKCLRKTFEKDDNEKIVKAMKVPKVVLDKCNKSWNPGTVFSKETKEYFLCIRSAMASLPLAQLLSELAQDPVPPKFTTVDRSVVPYTYEGHPQAQCRLDTYFNGTLCKVSHNVDLNKYDEVKGACHQSKTKIGNRSLCWFHPKDTIVY